MKNRETWQPSKYIYRKGRLTASRDKNEVGIGSRLIADIVASIYDANIPQYVKGKLIDLGCGKVPLFAAYKDYIIDNVCVDWKNTLHKNEYLDFECDLTKALPFENNSFETVILSDVLEHTPLPDHLWKEISRITAKDGIIMMNVPFLYRIHEEPNDYYRYTEFALRRFVQKNGLELIKINPIGGTPEILADILGKHFQRIPLIGKSMTIFLQYLTMTFIRTALGKRISEKTAQVFPLGYFLIARKI